MAIYGENGKEAKEIYANIDGSTKEITSVWIDRDGVPACVFQKPTDNIVTWTNGTDEEIAAMLEAHYNNEIDLADYWAVGDERVVHLSAMENGGIVTETHMEQDVIMVLMNVGGKNLYEPINGHTECAFIVGQKNCLEETGVVSNKNESVWDTCIRRQWCNEIYRNGFPPIFKTLFKQHKNVTASKYNSRSGKTSVDYFALPSEKEVLGKAVNANSNAESLNSQFAYYKTSANRIKNNGNNGSIIPWWMRSNHWGSTTNFCLIKNTGSSGSGSRLGNYGLAPFGCI